MRPTICFSLLLAARICAGPAVVPTAEPRTAFFDNIFAGAQRLDAEVDGLEGGGISLWRGGITYEQERNGWTVTTVLAQTWTSIDYEPTIVTSPAHRSEETQEASLEVRRRLSDAWELSAAARAYDGFSDYRSLWVAEYYDQFAGFLPGYEYADPRGAAVTLGGVWTYLPRAGKLGASFTYGRDHIVPAWTAEGASATRTRDVIDTISARLLWETALHPRLKMQHSLRVTDVTARSLRTQLNSELVWAATDRLSLRLHGGGAQESPDFDAWFAGAALEYEFTQAWHAGLSARWYEDTGELETSNFNTAAPGVSTRELAVSLLWKGESAAVRLSLGHYETNYDALSADNLFFGNLYRDRDFLTARLACTFYF